MILFLNFAPISFMGGAEKWMNDTAQEINSNEKSYIFSVAPSIANIYGRFVLNRSFDNRSGAKSFRNNIYLDFVSFIPFTKSWRIAKSYFKDSRVIYAKYEILEISIILYFLGLSGLGKTIAGLHSPFIYSSTNTFFEKLHNRVYASSFSIRTLSHTKKIHVLNNRDYTLLTKKFKLANTVYVPNGIDTESKTSVQGNTDNKLNILFVGELSYRKGVDILIEIIKLSKYSLNFTIAGDGPLRKQIEQKAKEHINCNYQGFVGKTQLKKIYEQNDVLILPSRAESMPLSILEAMSYGLTIVDSKEITLGLDEKIEISCNNNAMRYIEVLYNILRQKQNKKLNRQFISNYLKKNFSLKVIYPQLKNLVFN